MNENVKWYILEDWTGKELGRYGTLGEADGRKQHLIETDENYINAQTEEEREDIENGISEDLYIFGLDEEGNVVIIQW